MFYQLARAAAVISLVSALTGCGGALSGPPSDEANGNNVSSTLGTAHAKSALNSWAFSVGSHLVRSWVKPEAKQKDLMYISDPLGHAVYIYSYPAAKQVGTIGGLVTPAGMCTDSKQNVWITDQSNYEILEFAHGGTKPIQTLTQFGQYLLGCSVDPKTGALAVTSFCQVHDYVCTSPGSVFVYKNTTKNPTQYAIPQGQDAGFCGYDPNGNLFIDGQGGPSVPFILVELPAGASTAKSISLDRPIYWPGAVQWDGKYLAVGDQLAGNQNASSVHQIKIKGIKGTTVSTTPLHGVTDAPDPWIQGSTIVVPNYTDRTNDARFYKYPVGGDPTLVFGSGSYVEPEAAVVSLARTQRPKK